MNKPLAPAAAAAAAAKATAAQAPKVVVDAEMVYVRTVNASMLHLYTNVVFTVDPKKVPMDDFLRAQIDAGKLLVVEP